MFKIFFAFIFHYEIKSILQSKDTLRKFRYRAPKHLFQPNARVDVIFIDNDLFSINHNFRKPWFQKMATLKIEFWPSCATAWKLVFFYHLKHIQNWDFEKMGNVLEKLRLDSLGKIKHLCQFWAKSVMVLGSPLSVEVCIGLF